MKKVKKIVIIAEKPSQASNLSDAFGLEEYIEDVEFSINVKGKSVKNKQSIKTFKGNYENNEMTIIPCKGHLMGLRGRSSKILYFDFQWKIPTKSKRNADKYARFSLMKKYIKNADEIVIGTDADAEGELIGYNLVRHFNVLDKTTRMIFISMIEEELQRSFRERGDIREKIALSSDLRTWSDKVFGYIFSKYLTKAYQKAVNTKGYQKLPVGRVMTPVLYTVIKNMKYIEEAENELKNTEPKIVYDFRLEALVPSTNWNRYRIVFEDKIVGLGECDKDGNFYSISKEEAIKMRDYYSNVVGIVSKTKEVPYIRKPKESGLTIDHIRSWAYDNEGIDYTRTTSILQVLYISKLISYPRSESTILPKEPEYHENKLDNIMDYLGILEFKNDLVEREIPIMGDFSDGSHPAIHPTGKVPEKRLPEDYRIIYNYICKRYVKGFCKNWKFTKYIAEVEFTNLDDEDITRYIAEKDITYWTVNKFYGHEIVENPTLINYEIPDDEIIPEIDKGEQIPTIPIIEERLDSVYVPSRITKKDMFNFMRKKDLGTDATRDMILEKLWVENFVRGNKEAYATVLGINIIEAVRNINPELTKPDLTRQFEDKIKRVQNGGDVELLKNEIKEDITKIIEDKMDDMEDIGKSLAFFGECNRCGKRMKLVSWRKGTESLFFLACEDDKCDFTSSI